MYVDAAWNLLALSELFVQAIKNPAAPGFVK